MSDILWPEIYKKLGVKPVINARSWVTNLGGSLMPREVLSAMDEASKAFIDIVELHKGSIFATNQNGNRKGARIVVLLPIHK